MSEEKTVVADEKPVDTITADVDNKSGDTSTVGQPLPSVEDAVDVKDNAEDGNTLECKLCGKKVSHLHRKGKTVACHKCIKNIVEPIRNIKYKAKRNDACPCGAKRDNGLPKKFKNCCGWE